MPVFPFKFIRKSGQELQEKRVENLSCREHSRIIGWRHVIAIMHMDQDRDERVFETIQEHILRLVADLASTWFFPCGETPHADASLQGEQLREAFPRDVGFPAMLDEDAAVTLEPDHLLERVDVRFLRFWMVCMFQN